MEGRQLLPMDGIYQLLPLSVESSENDINAHCEGPCNSRELQCQTAKSQWQFVESSWFLLIAGCVIIANLIVMIVEAANPGTKQSLRVVDHIMLCFYIFELTGRLSFYGRLYFLPPWRSLAWNLLDLSVVLAGVLDQWLLPLLNVDTDKGPLLRVVLQCLRCLRLARVLKIIRIFVDSDLSWTENTTFQSFISLVITFNAVLMGMETDWHWDGWFYIEQVLLAIYVFELSVRLKRDGCKFFWLSNADFAWNVLDLVIVLTSIVDSWIVPLLNLVQKSMFPTDGPNHSHGKENNVGQIMMLVRLMRLMRILRLVKLLKSVRPLYMLIVSVLAAVQGVFWVLVLTVMMLYAMGICTTRLIGHGMVVPHGTDEFVKSPFTTVPESMFTLFRLMAGSASDDESDAIDALMAAMPTGKFFFVFFMVTSSWTLLSILTAVVSENMITTTGEQEHEMKLVSDEEDRAQLMADLMNLFDCIDVNQDGIASEEELLKFLSSKENVAKCAKACRVPAREIKEVFAHLSSDGNGVDMLYFTHCIADLSKPVNEKSIVKLERKLLRLEQKIDTWMADVKPPPEISLQSDATERQNVTNCHGGHGHLESWEQPWKARDQVHNSFLDTICVHEQALLGVLRKHDGIMSEMHTKLHDIKSLFVGSAASFDEASFCGTQQVMTQYVMKPQLDSSANMRKKSEERFSASTNDHEGIENINSSASDGTRCMLPTMAGNIPSASPEHLPYEDNTRAPVNAHWGNAVEKDRLEL